MLAQLPSRPSLVALATLCLALSVAVVLLATTAPGSPRAWQLAIRTVDGVPVGVRDTPAGALAAADNYVALASQTIEQDPAEFASLVAQGYVPWVRATALTEAERLRAGDVQAMRNYREGGHGLALIAARRLAQYERGSASVTSWLAGIVWGPHLEPRQTWDIVQTVLDWRGGRWQVVSLQVTTTSAPAPAIVYVQGENDRAGAFDRVLAGMSAPFYGSTEG
jgi:hypothetical protein